MKEAQLQRLMLDPALSRLVALQRSADDVLDIVDLLENQHSDVQGWMLDPREGHGHGDQILRDLLLAAAAASSGEMGLSAESPTALFFEHWTPARIQTTSFSAAFTAREHVLASRGRLDLIVIDPQNQLLVVIENKAGTPHTEAQLSAYVAEVRKEYLALPHLKDYRCAFLALDRAYDGKMPESRKQGSQWVHLGYDWLKAAADRAARDIARGNASAKLVMGYCIRQTDWENPESRRAMALAGQLHIDHGEAVQALLEHAAAGALVKQWLHGSASSLPSLFLLQNKRVLKLLHETRGFAAFEAVFSVELPGVNPDFVVSSRNAWVAVCPPSLERFDFKDLMPLYLEAVAVRGRADVYQLQLVYDRGNANPDQVAELELIAQRVHPALASKNTVRVDEQLKGRPAVVTAVKRWYHHMEKASRWVPTPPA